MSSDGHEVIFVGWERDPNRERRGSISTNKSYLYKGKWKDSRSSVRELIKYYYYLLCIIKENKPDVLHCVNEEVAILMLPFKYILYKKLVLDIYDGLSDRAILSNILLKTALLYLCKATYMFSNIIFVCDKRRHLRMGRYKYKTVILENTPLDPGANLSKNFPNGDVTISIVGNMTKRRGAEVVMCALRKTQNIRFVVAGYLDDYSKERFLDNSRIEYLGVVSPEKSLEIIASSDAAFAFYEPDTENHIYASPSKLFDCLSVGRPIIVNSEIKVSEWVRKNSLGYDSPYYDCVALSKVFELLKVERYNIELRSKRLRSMFIDGYSWNTMSDRLLSAYSNFDRNKIGG